MRPRVVAAVACRAGSTRLYAKPLHLVGDKPILLHLIDRLRSMPRLDDIVLAISNGMENDAFLEYTVTQELPYVRGSELDVLSRIIRAGDFVGADVILRVTPDCPFICVQAMNEVLDKHLEGGADLTHMIGLPLGAFGTVVNLAALRKAHRFGGIKYRTAWVTLFIRENPDLFQIRCLVAQPPLDRPEIRITVDYPEDLIVVRKIYAALHKKQGLITVPEIIAFLDDHPEIAAINNWIKPGAARIWD